MRAIFIVPAVAIVLIGGAAGGSLYLDSGPKTYGECMAGLGPLMDDAVEAGRLEEEATMGRPMDASELAVLAAQREALQTMLSGVIDLIAMNGAVDAHDIFTKQIAPIDGEDVIVPLLLDCRQLLSEQGGAGVLGALQSLEAWAKPRFQRD